MTKYSFNFDSYVTSAGNKVVVRVLGRGAEGINFDVERRGFTDLSRAYDWARFTIASAKAVDGEAEVQA